MVGLLPEDRLNDAGHKVASNRSFLHHKNTVEAVIIPGENRTVFKGERITDVAHKLTEGKSGQHIKKGWW